MNSRDRDFGEEPRQGFRSGAREAVWRKGEIALDCDGAARIGDGGLGCVVRPTFWKVSGQGGGYRLWGT